VTDELDEYGVSAEAVNLYQRSEPLGPLENIKQVKGGLRIS